MQNDLFERASQIELKLLRRFLMVAQMGSLAAAAPRLGLTQQALGAGLAKLEEELGIVLLDRGPGGAATVTAYGSLLIRHAKHLLAAADRAREELLAYRDARGGSVSIGIGEAFPPEVIATTVRQCHRERPQIRLSIVEGYSELLLEKLESGELDFIAGADARAIGDGLRRFPLFVARDVVIARAGHPLAGRRRTRLKDMQDFTWMVPRSRPLDARVISEAFRAEGLEAPAHFIWTDALNVGMSLLLSDDFLFMTSPAIVTGPLDERVVVALNVRTPTVERRVGLIYRSDTALNPSAMRLMDEIRHEVHAHIDRLSYASALNPGRRVVDAA